MATMALDRVLDLCRQVPRAMVENALYWGTPDDVVPRIVAEVEAGARHFALCNYVGFLSRADAPAATQALLDVVRRVRARFPELAKAPATIG
jgi:alkanesulfonate monooxygenase SsuD/methylene tetrahydromethanopterin reductase-like flavin-dependent oxidoreductase (luciferase family)